MRFSLDIGFLSLERPVMVWWGWDRYRLSESTNNSCKRTPRILCRWHDACRLLLGPPTVLSSETTPPRRHWYGTAQDRSIASALEGERRRRNEIQRLRKLAFIYLALVRDKKLQTTGFHPQNTHVCNSLGSARLTLVAISCGLWEV